MKELTTQPISWEQARQLVLQRLSDWITTIPPAERALKVAFRPPGEVGYIFLSPTDMLREVQLNTALGRKIIVAELNKIMLDTGISYVIQ